MITYKWWEILVNWPSRIFFWRWTNHRWPWKPKSQKGIQKTLSRVWSRINSSSYVIKRKADQCLLTDVSEEYFFIHIYRFSESTSPTSPPYTQRKATLQCRGTLAHTLEICLGTTKYLQGETSLWRRYELNPVSLLLLTVCIHFLSWCLWARVPRETNGPIQC